MNSDRNVIIRKLVRDLRKNSTNSERIFWEAIRNRKLNGKKFVRQFPLRFEIDGQKRFFIADFYCFESKLVIEIDGLIHERQKDYDELRELIIKEMGMRVVRFRNEDVEENLDEVLLRLKRSL